MARHGRSFPIRPHLARAIVGPPPPPPAPLFKPGTYTTTIARDRVHTRRTVPKPHLARPIVIPFIEFPALHLQLMVLVARHPRFARLPFIVAPKPIEPMVTIPEPGPPVLLGTIIARQPRQRPLRNRTVPPPHLAPEVRGVTPFPPALVIGQALLRPLSRRTVPRPHLAPTNLTPSGGRPFLYQTTVSRQARARMFVGRTVPAPHLPPSIIGDPPTPDDPFLLQTIVSRQAQRRPLTRRSLPLRPQIAPSLTAAEDLFTEETFLSLTFIGYAIERAKLGRTIPRPHVARPVLVRRPVRPGTFSYVAIERSHLLRTRLAPTPHTAPQLTPVIVAATGDTEWAWDFVGTATAEELDQPDRTGRVIGFNQNIGRPRQTKGE